MARTLIEHMLIKWPLKLLLGAALQQKPEPFRKPNEHVWNGITFRTEQIQFINHGKH